MSLFSSDRERRLWLWTLVVVVAIYSTLGLARRLAGVLRSLDLISTSFWIGLFLIAAAIVLQGLKTRPGGAEIRVALGVAGVYLIVLLRMAIPEERSHIIEYSVVALFIYEALMERASQGRRVTFPALLAVVVTALLGVLDESMQALLPSRVFSPFDILFNTLAAVMAVSANLALGWARRRRGT
jgi:hypothetical protein